MLRNAVPVNPRGRVSSQLIFDHVSIRHIVHYGCTSRSSQKLIAKFDPESAGGVSGQIVAKYKHSAKRPMEAEISVDLDLTDLDVDAIVNEYPECNPEALSFAWHVHAIWNNDKSSGFLGDCAPAKTGGHYDPTFACGPASHYINDPVCQSRNSTYACTPESYDTTRINCEMVRRLFRFFINADVDLYILILI